MENKKKGKHHFFIKFLFLAVAFAAITAYAYFFPATMKLLDKSLNKFALFSGRNIEISFFEDYSDFAKKIIDSFLYKVEIIIDNIGEKNNEAKTIPLAVISCAADFPVESGTVTSGFGKRNDPISGKKDIHTGIDVAAALGSDVKAAWPGTIFETGYDKIYGYYVVIKHSEKFFTKYCHLSKIYSEENSFVNAGKKIGEAGSTGRSTGSHLHFEVIIEGRYIDPKECFFA